MPDHSTAAIACRLQVIKHACPRLAHRAELVIAGDLLGDLAPFILFKDDTRSQVVDQRGWLKQLLNQHLKIFEVFLR